jgi:8-oxo-dGTP pyrophosphatase MutT (NUDIX family)
LTNQFAVNQRIIVTDYAVPNYQIKPSLNPQPLITLDQITQALSHHDPHQATPGQQTRQAAVAIILCAADPGSHEIEVGFILRATREGDPWSAQMAFPGGHLDPSDDSLKEAAIRETREEIDVDLCAAQYLGSVGQQHAMPRGRRLDMIIDPHVFSLPLVPQSNPNYEVAEVVWTPLQHLMSNRWHDTEQRPMNNEPTIFNGYRLPTGHFVWGLTYRIVKEFFSLIDPTWQPPKEL